MSYKHIVVAIDLHEPSDVVIAKAVNLAESLKAKLSFVTVDISHLDMGLREYDPAESHLIQERYDTMMEQFTTLLDVVEYPIENKLVLMGEVEEKIVETVNAIGADLLISGHHHGFWNTWWSSARKLVGITPVDLLLIHI